MKKDLNWFKEQLDDIEMNTSRLWSHNSIWMLDRVNELLDQLDEPDYTYDAYREGFKEGERQTAEYFENITEEPSKEQVWKYLSEHGIEVVDKEPETVGSVLDDFYKSLERMKEVLSMEVEELEE